LTSSFINSLVSVLSNKSSTSLSHRKLSTSILTLLDSFGSYPDLMSRVVAEIVAAAAVGQLLHLLKTPRYNSVSDTAVGSCLIAILGEMIEEPSTRDLVNVSDLLNIIKAVMPAVFFPFNDLATLLHSLRSISVSVSAQEREGEGEDAHWNNYEQLIVGSEIIPELLTVTTTRSRQVLGVIIITKRFICLQDAFFVNYLVESGLLLFFFSSYQSPWWCQVIDTIRALVSFDQRYRYLEMINRMELSKDLRVFKDKCLAR
jgi:hypothetical protein